MFLLGKVYYKRIIYTFRRLVMRATFISPGLMSYLMPPLSFQTLNSTAEFLEHFQRELIYFFLPIFFSLQYLNSFRSSNFMQVAFLLFFQRITHYYIPY